MATSYISAADFATRTIMSPAEVARLEERRPGFLASNLLLRSAEINARLSKRYATPFAAPVPEIVVLWLVQIVTLDAYQALGFAPTGSDEGIAAAAKSARDALEEAAKSDVGLYELPLRADTSAEGVSRGGPIVLTETSPYEALHREIEARR